MAIKIKIPRVKGFRGSLKNPFFRAGLAAFLIISLVLFGVFSYYYIKYQKIVDKRMSGPIFANTAKIYAQPRDIRIGQKADPREISNYLRHAGYTEAGEQGKSKFGVYKVMRDAIEIKPGEESYYNAEGAVVRIKDGHVDKIASLGDAGDNLTAYELEPQLVTGLFDGQARSKRRLVKYDDIPKVMVDAVTSIEDRRFFHHSGVNYWRLMQAGWVDLRQGGNRQGGSTITMQVARGFFLSPEKKLKRKLTEILISIELEQRFSKKQIFELYANQVDMGQRGSFTITGFGEAAQAYFSKDLKDITLPEAALLAGLVQRPSYLSPYRHPERAQDRRNLVLEAMVETGTITRDQADTAKATPLKLAPQNVEASDAPYFVDLIREQLVSKYGEEDLNADGFRIYTTLDPTLQQAAAQAVDLGLKEVDAQVTKLRTKKVKVGKNKFETKVMPGPIPQVALVALDPHTGEVLALVGGRNYGFSQLNHAVAKRPTGSIFKPFVYAAAVNNAVTNEQPIFTPASLVDDSPTAFINGDDVYTPRNYKEEYHGQVTAQFALAHSLNNATVKVAEMVGYDNVVKLAKAAGLNEDIQPTPAVALGAYETTPIEIAGAYTIFANQGMYVKPNWISSVRGKDGSVLYVNKPETRPVLDPRVSYLMVNLLEEVMRSGTAAAVRARGFTVPAAGKTGTSHDGWFAGFTSELLCVVWVGFDDNRELNLEGAHSALPIWADFMKKALQFRQYKDAKPFEPPEGIVSLTVDSQTGMPATPFCPETRTEVFIAGTQPVGTCPLHGGGKGATYAAGWDTPAAPAQPQPVVMPVTPVGAGSSETAQKPRQTAANASDQQGSKPPEPPAQVPKRKGVFRRLMDVFK